MNDISKYSGISEFKYKQWTDRSNDQYSMDYVVKVPSDRYEIIPIFTPEVKRQYDLQKTDLRTSNLKGDHYQYDSWNHVLYKTKLVINQSLMIWREQLLKVYF